jgi:cytochrome P450
MGEAMAVFPPHVHPQIVITYLHKKYNLPDVWYLDLYPLGPTFLVLATPEAASHAVLTRNYGKHPAVEELLIPIVGRNSFVALNGAPWKYSQQLLAPAFKPRAVRGILPSVAEEVLAMRDLLAHKAETGEVFEMEEMLSGAIFEVILMSIFGDKLEGGTGLMDVVREPTKHMTRAQRTSNPIAKRWCRWKAMRALEKSGAWIEKRTLDRYWYIKREDVKVGGNMADAILVDRVRDEQASKFKVTLDQDRDWMTMWKTQYVQSCVSDGVSLQCKD